MYEDFLNFIADAVKTLNEFEKRHENDKEGLTPYLASIEVHFEGELVGHLVDEVGGSWCYMEKR